MIPIDETQEILIGDCVRQAAASLTKGDALAYTSSSQGVSFEFSRLHSIEDTSSTALSCRAFQNDRAGVAFVNEPSQWKTAAENALASARFGEEVAFELPQAHVPAALPWAYSPKNCAYTKEQLKDMGSDLLASLKKEAPGAKITADISLSYSRSFLGNSEGFFGEDRSSSLGIMGGVFELDAEGSFIELYEGQTFFDQAPDQNLITRPLIQHLEWSRSTVPFQAQALPVLFAPSAMGILIDPLLAAANGKILNKGLSVLEGKEGQPMLSPLFTLVDNPLRLHGYSYAFDDEGVPAKELPIFENGAFKNFIFDCASAAKKQRQSTGHGRRGIAALPAPAFSNTCVRPGSNSFARLLADIDRGILLCEGLGEGQSNTLAGDFSILGSGAFLIKNGKIAGRVKDIMFSGNVYDVLKRILAVSSEEIQNGALFAPYVLVEGISLSSAKEE